MVGNLTCLNYHQIELHIHIDASARYETLHELVKFAHSLPFYFTSSLLFFRNLNLPPFF